MNIIKKGFTIIEIMVVVAIIAVLAVVVIYMVNPGQLLKQGQDGNRVEAIGTINKAISLYYSDAINNPSTLFMGTSSIVYISVPDPTATTTAGTNCAGLGLASTSITYHCAASSTYLKTDGTGWIPIDFASTTFGNPIASLPIDPVNTATCGQYYAYETDGVGGYQIIANPAATKDLSNTASFDQGSNLTLMSSFPCPISYTTSTAILLPSGVFDGIAFDPHTNTVWAGDFSGNENIYIINDTSYATTSLGASPAPYRFAFDSNANTVWVANYDSNGDIQIFNDTTHSGIGRYNGAFSYGTWLSNVAFDSHTNTDWVTNLDTITGGVETGTVDVFNDTTDVASSTTYAVNGPEAVVFDPHTNTDWVADAWDNNATVFNDTTYATSTYAVGTGPWAIAFDSHTNTVWVANYTSNNVTVFNDTTYATSTYAVGTGPDAIAFDPHTNTVWVANYGSSTVSVFNDTTYATSTYAVGLPGYPTSIAVDSHTNAIWVAGDEAIHVFTPSW